MDGLINFGSIIEWKCHRYVYLIEVGQIIYLARIVEGIKARKFIDRRDFLEANSVKGNFSAQNKLKDPIYCFVILTTTDFAGDLALLHSMGNDSNSAEDIFGKGQLNKEDLEKLKTEIKNNKDSIAKEVVNYVNSLD